MAPPGETGTDGLPVGIGGQGAERHENGTKRDSGMNANSLMVYNGHGVHLTEVSDLGLVATGCSWFQWQTSRS
ncbi:hypothetical protein DPPLL_00590 [Desulfofustis limnaeus]|uniref:Uncharacterized protein n=1 Tax=Desulfofustis limnaeus TaxID=2740163 RepID=A0ABN6M312_9BACT|nr:hypothetical protein DPPLL_00590 [Desulfofustis limnaeus]